MRPTSITPGNSISDFDSGNLIKDPCLSKLNVRQIELAEEEGNDVGHGVETGDEGT